MKTCSLTYTLLIIIILFIPFISFSQEGKSKTSSSSGGWTGNINVSIATKDLDENQWSPYQEHASFTYSLDFSRASNGWGFVLSGVTSTSDNGEKIEVAHTEVITEETRVGLIKTWYPSERFRIYVSGGATLIKGSINTASSTVEGEENGTFYEFGVYWTLINAINLGFVIDTSMADIILDDTTYNAGGHRSGFIIGYHW